MIAFEDIERACCTTKCEGVARGICPYFGQKDKINRCERIKTISRRWKMARIKKNNKDVFQSYVLTTAKYDFSVYEKRIMYRLVEMAQKM